LCNPLAITYNPNNKNLLIGDFCSNKIRSINLTTTYVKTLAGTGGMGSQNGPVATANFNQLFGIGSVTYEFNNM
jgi:hypothetical protein